MSWQLDPGSSRRPDIEPVLPLINIVFLLLIFFMVAGHLGPTLPANLHPPASASATPEPPQHADLVIHRDGSLSWRGQPISLGALPDRLDGLGKERPLEVLTDGRQPVAVLRPALSALRRAGITDIVLITRSRP